MKTVGPLVMNLPSAQGNTSGSATGVGDADGSTQQQAQGSRLTCLDSGGRKWARTSIAPSTSTPVRKKFHLIDAKRPPCVLRYLIGSLRCVIVSKHRCYGANVDVLSDA